ncbi:MAG: hypothetical protein ABSE08_16435 [Syntrophobacteraceae bacterium]
MNRPIRFFALALIALFLIACHRGQGGNIHLAGDVYTPQPDVFSPYKVKVSDVFNDTHQVYDVDVIGLMWNGLEDSLKKRGMLLVQPQAGVEPYVMEAHIVSFKRGEIAACWLPYVGDTVLVARVDLKQGGKVLATLESKHKTTLGKGTMSLNAAKTVFDQVSEDIVNQAVKKF